MDFNAEHLLNAAIVLFTLVALVIVAMNYFFPKDTR